MATERMPVYNWLSYDLKSLRDMMGDDEAFSIFISAGHSYIFWMRKPLQRIMIAHMRKKAKLLRKAGLLEDFAREYRFHEDRIWKKPPPYMRLPVTYYPRRLRDWIRMPTRDGCLDCNTYNFLDWIAWIMRASRHARIEARKAARGDGWDYEHLYPPTYVWTHAMADRRREHIARRCDELHISLRERVKATMPTMYRDFEKMSDRRFERIVKTLTRRDIAHEKYKAKEDAKA